MDWTYWATLCAVAPTIGLIGMYSGGFWGVGCGWLVVPTMLIFGFTPMEAAGVGLLQMAPSMIGTVCKEAPQIGWGAGAFGRNLTLPMALGALVTSFCGLPINEFFHRLCGSTAISVGFAGFMLFIGWKTLFGAARSFGDESPTVFNASTRFWAFVCGLGAGVFSSVLGVGGAMVFRPALANGFKATEEETARSVRFLLLTTTLTGGATYLFSGDGFDETIFVLAALIAVGGAVGFPLGARSHRVVLEAGRSNLARRSFAIICGIVLINVSLKLAGLTLASQIATGVCALGLTTFLVSFVWWARRNPTPDSVAARRLNERTNETAPTPRFLSR
ncbi:MAG: sulfite exporter TauE/SafE family protein [Thermoguttaceae bacterium]|nr:sulfite exporter TauE/SafE family protein [Thermoguttaceae bacterium]